MLKNNNIYYDGCQFEDKLTNEWQVVFGMREAVRYMMDREILGSSSIEHKFVQRWGNDKLSYIINL